MRIGSYLAVLALIALSQPAYAEPIYPCDYSCSSLFSASRQLAMSLPVGTKFSVIDVKTWEAGTYVVEHIYRMGEMLERAKKVSTTSNVLNATGQLQADQAAVQTLKVNIPPEIADSVHSVVLSAQIEDDVATYAASNMDVFAKIGALADAALSVFGKIVDLRGYIEVEFSDGSIARFELTGLGEDDDGNIVFELKLMEGSAKDSDGNNIPTSEGEIVGERTFTSEGNRDRFIGVVDFYGVTTEYGGCASATAAVCVRKSGGGYTCTTFTYCR